MSAANLLIVDDDPALLDALSEALRLRMDGLQIDTCDSGLAALERIAATDYDALVVDIKMPGMDGLELLAEIKKLRPETPTLLITGHGDHELAVQALRGGAYDYVTKPIDRDYFVSSLTHAIECRRLSADVAQKRFELTERAEELEACVRERTRELRHALHNEQTARTELEKAKQDLESMSEEREVFIAMISHDLSQPLTTLRGYAEMLGRSSTSPEMQERARSLILSETYRLARLAGDLANAAHLSAGQFTIRQAGCDLAEIAREQVELARARTDRHTIHLDAPYELESACDRDRLGQVLSNLLTNAITHTSGGEIWVRLWREGDQARISVIDQGPGIPPDQAEAVFVPGRRLANAGAAKETSGSGLGLHITRRIVEAHGGQIWVENQSGAGAIFTLQIPLAPASVGTSGR